MYRERIADRKIEVMFEASRRYKVKAPAVAEAAAKLAAGGPLAAASEVALQRYSTRQTAKLYARISDPTGLIYSPGQFFEKRIGPGDDDWVDLPPPEARQAGRPVARIVELTGRSRIADGFATGFVVPPGLFVTNWHVFAGPEDAYACGAQFGYENDESGMPAASVVFEIDPQTFFFSDEAHDIAIIGLAQRAVIGVGVLSDFGAVTLIPSLGKILVGQAINIIQHPDGQSKKWALQKNTLYAEPSVDDLFLMYTTDTLEGSSGSPAFNKDWELVAVHHGGVPRIVDGDIRTVSGGLWKKGMPETDIEWVANEGARVSKIYALLKNTKLNDVSQQALLDKLLVAAGEVPRGEAAPRPKPAVLDQQTKWSQDLVNITVHGTANFYFGPPATWERGAEPVRTGVSEPTSGARRLSVNSNGTDQTLTHEKKLRFDPDYDGRPGYKSDFLDNYDVPLPEAPPNEVYEYTGGLTVLNYHHYSLVMHRDRRLAIWTAANVDYDKLKRRFERDDFGDDDWKPDPRIPNVAQLEDAELYDPAKKFDRGHIVRRADSAWGVTKEEEEFANADTFHWTNCTPQHEHFNRDMFQYNGLWGQLENYIATQAKFVANKLIVFAGSILSEDDPDQNFGAGLVKVPMAFWKIVIVAEDGDNSMLRAYGFILDQTEAVEDYGWERRFQAGRFSERQVSLTEISARSRVKFDDILHDADPLAGSPEESLGRRLSRLERVKLE